MGWWDRGMLEEKKSGDDVGLGLGLGDAILQFPPPHIFLFLVSLATCPFDVPYHIKFHIHSYMILILAL